LLHTTAAILQANLPLKLLAFRPQYKALSAL